MELSKSRNDDSTCLVIQIHGDDSMTSRCSTCSHIVESWYAMKCPGCHRKIVDALLNFEAFDDEPQVLGRPDGFSE